MRWRILRRALLIAAAALALISLCAVVWLSSGAGRRWVLGTAAAALRENTGLVLEARGFDYSLFSGGITVEDATLRAEGSADLPPLVEVRRLRAAVRYFPPSVEMVEANGLAVRLHFTADGRGNLPPSKGGPPARLNLDSLPPIRIEGGSFNLEHPQALVELPDFTLDLAHGKAGLRAMKAGRLRAAGADLPVRVFTIAGRAAGETLTIDRARIEVGEAALDVTGEVHNPADPRFALALNLAAPAGTLPGAGLTGGLQASGKLIGKAGLLAFEGSLAAAGLRREGWPVVELKAGTAWSQERSVVRLEPFEARTAGGTVTGDATLAYASGPSRANIRIAGVRLEDWMAATGISPRLGSLLSADAVLSWPGLDFSRATGTAALRLVGRAVSLAGQAEPPAPPPIPLSGELRVAADASRVRVDAGYIEAEGVRLAGGSVVLDRRNRAIAGSLEGDFRRQPIDGVVSWRAALAGTLSAPEAALNFSSASLSYGPLRGAALAGQAAYRNGNVAVENTMLDWRGQRLRLSGAVDLATPPKALTAHAHIEGAAIGTILEGLGHPLPIEGTVTLDAEASGTLDNPEARFSLTGDRLQAWGQPLGPLAAQGHYGDRRAVLDTLRLGALTASGSANLDTREIDWRMEGRRMAATSFLPTDGIPVHGEFSLRAAGKGTWDAPQLTAEVAGQRVNVAGRDAGALESTLSLDGGKALLTAGLPEAGVHLQADVVTAAPYPAAATLTIDRAGLDRLGLSLGEGQPVTGELTGAVRYDGPLAEWRNATIGASLASLTVRAADETLTLEQPLIAGLRGGALTVEPARVRLGGGSFEIGGGLPAGLTLRGTMSLDHLARRLPPDMAARLTGTAVLDASARGPFENPDLAAQLTVEGAEAKLGALPEPLRQIGLKLRLANERLELEKLEARFAGAALEASGSAPTGWLRGAVSREPARLTARLDKLDLAAFRQRGLAGSVAASAEFSASKLDLRAVTGAIRFGELSLQQRGGAFAQKQPVRLAVRDGRLLLEEVELSGPGGALRAEGSIGLLGDRPLEVRVSGKIDTSLAAGFQEDLSLAGPLTLELFAKGPARNPEVRGSAALENGRFALLSPTLAGEEIAGSIRFEGRRVTIERLSGNINGGAFEASGALRFDERIEDVRLKLTARNIFLDYPEGLKSLSNAAIEMRSEGPAILVTGLLDVQEGAYRDAIDFQNALKRKPGAVDLYAGPSPFLDRLRFNVGVRTSYPVALDNNLARLHAAADLRLVGTPRRPALTGRFEIEPGGQVYVGERTFTVERGSVDFIDENSIRPALNLSAYTNVGAYQINLQTSGAAEDLRVNFTSEPTASEQQIWSLLLTGSPDNTGQFSGNVAERQALSLFGSSMVGRFNLGIRRAVGLSEFRVEPSLISSESNPTARLTIGQNITDDLKLIYSTSLTDSADQQWIAEYNWRRRLAGRFVRQRDNTSRGEIRHRLRLGGGPLTGEMSARSRRAAQYIGKVELGGNLVFPETEVRKRLGLGTGGRYDFIQVQKAADSLASFYAARGYLEARVRRERHERGDTVDLRFHVDAGPKVTLAFEGRSVPGNIEKAIRQAWREGVVDFERGRAGAALIRRHLYEQGYADAEVKADIREAGGSEKRAVFEIVPGPKYARVELVFEGAPRVLAGELRAALRAAKLDTRARTNPAAVREFAERWLTSQGYLAASAGAIRVERLDGGRRFLAVLPVNTGPAFRLGKVVFSGQKQLAEGELRAAVYLEPGEPYRPADLDRFREGVEQLYYERGFRDAEVAAAAEVDKTNAAVDVAFQIRENLESVIAGVEITGEVKTSESFIQKLIRIGPGDTSESKRMDLARRRLADSRAYNLVDVSTAIVPEWDRSTSAFRPVNLVVRVREPKPYRFDYGPLYDGERGIGFVGEASVQNVLGEARSAGYRFLFDGQRKESRFYFSQPFLASRHIETTASAFIREDTVQKLNFRYHGFSVQQAIRLRPRLTFTYGYEYELGEGEIPFLDFTIPIRVGSGPFVFSANWDTRDNMLDATRGLFLSQAGEIAPAFMPGVLSYYRYFGQAFRYFPLTKPALVPFEGTTRRSRVVFATGARLGFANSLNQFPFIPTDLFFAGGGTTLRGFARNTVGPVFEGTSQPSGGKAMLLLNNELRFPLYKWLDGVGFADIGNVYAEPSQVSFRDVRKSAGFGVRVRNPFVLLRFDYGWNLDRRTGEARGAFFFSVGQAF